MTQQAAPASSPAQTSEGTNMADISVVKEPEFRDDVTVQLIRSAAQDSDVVWSARVSTAGETSVSAVDQDPAEAKGLINFLLKNRHGTPFEHNSMTFMISAPIFVFREFHRHRVGWSYNEESGRYRQLEPVFYLPSTDRKLIQVGKAGHYTFEDGTPEQYETVRSATIRSCTEAYNSYQEMLDAGVAREVARAVLPVATYSTMYATCNARSLMSFLSLRTKNEDSAFPSYPQREIEMVAEKMEAEWAQLMPITYDAFISAGRVSP
ncbi:MAG: FAD-dependent thymidylate synthase [Candidatus Nanopelagicales bacterium]